MTRAGSFEVYGLNPNTTYTFEVRAYIYPGGDYALYSTSWTGTRRTPVAPVPNTPSLTVSLSSFSPDEIAGVITASTGGVEHNRYRWRRREGPSGNYGSWDEINTTFESATFFDSGLTSGVTYYYQAQAGNDNGWSSTRSASRMIPNEAVPSQMPTPTSQIMTINAGYRRYRLSWPVQTANPIVTSIIIEHGHTRSGISPLSLPLYEETLGGSETEWTSPDLTMGLA